MESVLCQTYPSVQLIVVDDASTDDSAAIIREFIKVRTSIEFIALSENAGNCHAFNRGLARAKGEFVIDLAADDVLLPQRIMRGVEELTRHGKQYGVHFSDALLIDTAGHRLGLHSDRFPHDTIPHGDLYRKLVVSYFICSPTMMMRREVFDHLGGYDESLAYEDFDFWIRSSRTFRYCYSPEVLVKRRMLKNSMARSQFRPDSPQRVSTFRVCEKMLHLNRDPADWKAFRERVRYEIRKSLEIGSMRLAWKYFRLLFR
jgi:glycosyltransferase involved in cell wall biosynthesis